MAEISAGIHWSGEEPYCRHWGGKTRRLVRHRTPPRNEGGGIEDEAEFLFVSCCSVRVSTNRS